MAREKCLASRCRRVVREDGAVHCERCYRHTLFAVKFIRRHRGDHRHMLIFWAMVFGTFNRAEVNRLFPKQKAK